MSRRAAGFAGRRLVPDVREVFAPLVPWDLVGCGRELVVRAATRVGRAGVLVTLRTGGVGTGRAGVFATLRTGGRAAGRLTVLLRTTAAMRLAAAGTPAGSTGFTSSTGRRLLGTIV